MSEEGTGAQAAGGLAREGAAFHGARTTAANRHECGDRHQDETLRRRGRSDSHQASSVAGRESPAAEGADRILQPAGKPAVSAAERSHPI